jgi:CDP-diacylglycerol--serine O-phosphatidyltransferase
MNVICGFIAIIYVGQVEPVDIFVLKKVGLSPLGLSGYMIFLAMIPDMMDGWFARLTDSVSDFGAHLDSLSDAVSFGAAPAFLMYKLEKEHLEIYKQVNPYWGNILDKGVFIAAIIYLVCTIIRLARFNIENIPPPDAPHKNVHEDFSGLPSPAAAGIVAGFVVFLESFLPKIVFKAPEFSHTSREIILIALPFITLGASFLMVSRIPFPPLTNMIIHARKTPPFFVFIFLLLLLSIFYLQITLLFCFLAFTFGGIIYALVKGLPPKVDNGGGRKERI